MVTIPMARRGYACTGVDISADMLAEASRKIAETQYSIDLHCRDASALDLDFRKFDAAISLFDSLNNITDPSALLSAFRCVFEHLASPGIFIFDLNTEYAFRWGMFDQASDPMDGPLQYVWRSKYDRETRLCRIEMSFQYVDDAHPQDRPEVFHEVHMQRAYGIQEVIDMLTNAGFDSVHAFDAYTFEPVRKRSDRVFFAAGRDALGSDQYSSTQKRSKRR
jgi:SAM-dependent methyltransferase